MGLILHRLLQRDLRSVLAYYRDEGGDELARRFHAEFEQLVAEICRHPQRFHSISELLRRANFRSFPYHLLYRVTGTDVRILVLRHHRRGPSYGVGRR
jgi:plasmid stabilization system protein ParE